MTKIIVSDGSAEWNDDVFESMISEYAEIIRIEKEMIYTEGIRTSCTTGTRYIYVTKVNSPIPPKVEVLVDSKVFSLTVWYRGQSENTQENSKCAFCGADHKSEQCSHKKRVCFTCQGEDHTQKDCPENKGVKSNKDTFIFYNSKLFLYSFLQTTNS